MSAPQELVAMIVGKAVNLARSLEVPVVGLVEHMDKSWWSLGGSNP